MAEDQTVTDDKPVEEAAEAAATDTNEGEIAPAPVEGPDGISAESHTELQASHPEFAGNWSHLQRFHALVREKRMHHALLNEWNAWRQEVDQVDLRGAVAHKGNLRECDLHNADLRGARLTEALLGSANLAGANCQGTAFRGADMVDTQLDGAQLHGADMRWVRRTTQEQFAQTQGDDATTLPQGITKPGSW